MSVNSLGKKAGYLKGLMENLDFSDPGQEKLMRAMVDLLNELCDRAEAVDDLLDDLNDYVESIDDDLAQLEGDRDDDFSLLDEDDFEDEEYMDDADDASDRLHLIGGKEEDDGEPEVDTIAGVVCPSCQQPFFVGLDDPEGSLYTCPHCGRRVTPNPLTPENAPIAKPLEDE